MAKHRAISQHSLQARTVIGGVVASGALLVAAPAGMALAGPNSCNAQCQVQHRAAVVNHISTSPVGEHVIGALPPKAKAHVLTAAAKWITKPLTKPSKPHHNFFSHDKGATPPDSE